MSDLEFLLLTSLSENESRYPRGVCENQLIENLKFTEADTKSALLQLVRLKFATFSLLQIGNEEMTYVCAWKITDDGKTFLIEHQE